MVDQARPSEATCPSVRPGAGGHGQGPHGAVPQLFAATPRQLRRDRARGRHLPGRASWGDPCLACAGAGLGDVDSLRPRGQCGPGPAGGCVARAKASFDAAWTASRRLRPDPGARRLPHRLPPLRRVVGSRGPTSGRCARPPGRPTPSWRCRRRPQAPRTRGADPAHHWKERAADREAARWATEALAGTRGASSSSPRCTRRACSSRGRERSKTTIIKLVHEAGCTCASWAAGWGAWPFEQVMDFACCGPTSSTRSLPIPGRWTTRSPARRAVPQASVAGAAPPSSRPLFRRCRSGGAVARRRSRWPARHRPVGDPRLPGSYEGTARVSS